MDLSSNMFIPVGLPLKTSGPTKSDGYYHATTNREHYQKIPSDYQEIDALTNVIKEGKPIPAAEIFLLYELGMHTRIGVRSKTLRGFARDPERAEEFPIATEYYGSGTFLDCPINNAIRGRGAAENYSDAQKRQAINKGILRVLYHWSKHYVIGGCADLDSGDVDEGWAIYVGLKVDGDYPNSLSALARSREGNFRREGTIDIPLRQAFERVRQAAERGDSAACDAAAQEVFSRYNAMSYLATVRYIGVTYSDVAEGKDPGPSRSKPWLSTSQSSLRLPKPARLPTRQSWHISRRKRNGITEESQDAALVLGQIKNGTGRDGGACVWRLGQ